MEEKRCGYAISLEVERKQGMGTAGNTEERRDRKGAKEEGELG